MDPGIFEPEGDFLINEKFVRIARGGRKILLLNNSNIKGVYIMFKN